jgi:hypothetical protein
VSVDRARTMGLTARDLAAAIADAELDGDESSAPTRPYGAPVIGGLDIPAAWAALGEPREEQQ